MHRFVLNLDNIYCFFEVEKFDSLCMGAKKLCPDDARAIVYIVLSDATWQELSYGQITASYTSNLLSNAA